MIEHLIQFPWHEQAAAQQVGARVRPPKFEQTGSFGIAPGKTGGPTTTGNAAPRPRKGTREGSASQRTHLGMSRKDG